MDINLLPAFVAIYDLRSVSAAASKLKLSQPGMSALLGRLRTAFNDPLFLRTPTGMVPTARARALEEPVRRMLDILEREILVSKDFQPADATNEFRLATSDGGEVAFLPPVLKMVNHEAPEVRITSLVTREGEVERLMENNALDLAVGFFPDLQSSNVIETVIGRYGFSCFVGRQNRFAERDISTEEFGRVKHALVNPDGRKTQIADQFLRECDVEHNITFRTAHFLCMPEILASTDLFAIMPDIVRGHASFSKLARVRLPFAMPQAETKMYWSRTLHDDPAHRWFRKLAARAIGRVASPAEPQDGAAPVAAESIAAH